METTSFIAIAEKSKKHQQLSTLLGLIEMIAQCQSRINTERNFCEQVYGRNHDGFIKCQQSNIDTIKKYNAIAARVKQYYNFKLAQLNQFKTV